MITAGWSPPSSTIDINLGASAPTLPGDIEMQYANHIGYSDVNPYEIVRRVSDRTIEIR